MSLYNHRDAYVELDHSSHQSGSIDFGRSSVWSRNRRLIVVGVLTTAVVVALALGLGLGLGLSSGDEHPPVQPTDSPESTGCRSKVPYDDRKAVTAGKLPVNSRRTSQTGLCGSTPPCSSSKIPLIVLSLDGFRAEYLLRNSTPTIQSLISCGAHAPYMRAVFPTKTFVNHYTLVTGLYPESHGIIANMFYDPLFNEVFNMGGRNNSDNRWWLGEPIWNTAKKQGKKVATVFWPGSDVNIQNMRPDICYNYNGSVPLDDRVAEVLSFFDGSDKKDQPDLVHMYFEQPDSTGHAEGPLGDSVEKTLAYVDDLIGQLVDGLNERLGNCFNFIVTADHGMSVTDRCKRVVDLRNYIDISKYTIYDGTHVRLSSQYKFDSYTNVSTIKNPVPVSETLSQLACQSYSNTKDWFVRVMAKEDLPKRYHYSNSRRIDDIVLDVSDEYFVSKNKSAMNVANCVGGDHGYDNTFRSMHAIFVGYGPAFKQNVEIDAFENIEFYNLLADVLGIEPAPNNGTPGRLHRILVNPPTVQRRASELKTLTPFSSDCQFPSTADDVGKRRNASDCSCAPADWLALTGLTVDQADLRLNLSTVEVDNTVQRHLPTGVPQTTSNDTGSLCQLAQVDYVLGYSQALNLPLWAAFTVTPGPVSVLDKGGIRSDDVISSCSRVDVRLSQPNNCSTYENTSANIVPSFLYPPGLSGNDSRTDGYISTNMVPMYRQFKEGVWNDALVLMEEYGEKYRNVNIVAGPIFDYDADGHADTLANIQKRFVSSIPVPSHYFLVASYCNSTVQVNDTVCEASTVVLSLVLPHQPTNINCWASLTTLNDLGYVYLKENVARVRDIELLTGLKLFSKISTSYRAELVTSLAEELWPRLSWMDLGVGNTESCPTLGTTPSCPSNYANRAMPPLILISLDGFRPDYLDRGLTPTLKRLFNCGVTAPYMKSVYPSMTFPNHYSIATGLYPESHGIIDNNMYDVNLNESFYLGSATSTKPHWWSGEPIWNTVVKHNKYAMTYFWPGSDVEINGMRPTDYRNYSSSHPYSLRVDTALQWLNGSVNGLTPDLVVLYFSKVDEAGHEGGPHSLEVNEALETVDDAILQLMDGLYRLHLHTCVNIMIVSDHGMSDMSCDRSILVGNYLSGEVMNKTYMYTGSAGRISNKYYADSKYNYYELAPDQQVSIANITNTLSCVTPYMAVYDKQYLPRQFHYINNIRIDDVQLIVVDTYMTEKTEPWCPIRGYHGWDARYDSMKALFIGYGPTFRQRSTVPPFENIELYNLMTYLVNVTSAANNGTAGRLNNLLHTPPPQLDDSILAVPYQHVQFPGDSLEYELRINATVTGCPCSLTNNGSLLLSYDDRLNTTESDWNMLQLRHVPHGLPLYVNTSTASPSQYLLHHGDFVSAYSDEMLMPLWTAANITASSKTNFPEASVNCSRVDVRLNANQAQPTCNSYLSKANLLPTYLFPPHWSQDFDSSTEAQLLTNVVPMSSHFQTVVWQFMLQYIQNVTVKYPGEQIYVVMGPVFDYDADGLKDTNLTLARLAVAGGSDIPVPSHYFVLLLKCLNVTSCIQQDYDALSFIVPQWQTPGSSNCLNTVQFLHMNAARIRDIELLTGLQFLSESASQRAVQIRTVVAEKLW